MCDEFMVMTYHNENKGSEMVAIYHSKFSNSWMQPYVDYLWYRKTIKERMTLSRNFHKWKC
jgi:hypothetical protein